MERTDAQRLARIAGWLFIATIVFSIPGTLLYGPLLDHKDYIVGAGSDTQIALGAFLEILTAIAGIGTAVVLYPIVKRQSQSMALGYVATRVLESTVIVIGIVSVLSVVTLRRDVAGTPGADNASLILAGQQLKAFHDMTFLLGPSFCAAIGNGIILGTLMYRSGLVPRRLALVGLIGGPLALIAATGALFNVYDQNSAPQALLTIPEVVWEGSLGIYLIVKGFRAAGLDKLGVPRGEVSVEAARTAAPEV
jgi:hypothetical protein